MRQYKNEKIIEIKVNEEEFWNTKVMNRINRHRILHCRKVSSLGIPIIYFDPIEQKYVLDMYMYNKKSIKGKKYYHLNSLGQIVLPRMYRYTINKEIADNFFCTESIGKAYNDAIKKSIQIAPYEKKFDFMNNLDKAPTERDIAKIARKVMI